MKKLRVTIEGRTYEVLVEVFEHDALTTPVAAAAPSPGSVAAPPVTAASPAPAAVDPSPRASPAGPGGPGTVVSPLAGKIVSIDVKVGQAVAEGAQVATIEAMKMNTFIYAPKAGQVTEVLVNPGDAVDEGAALMRLG